MKFRDAFLAAVAGVALAASIGAAIAQTVTLPTVGRVDTDDLVQVIKHGMPTAQSRFATAAQVNGPTGYATVTPLTAFTIAYGKGQTNLLITPAGTLGTGTLTMELLPGNGQLECIRSTQTQSALTWSAPSGTTVTGAPSALTANTTYCMIYNQAATTWNLWSVSAG